MSVDNLPCPDSTCGDPLHVQERWRTTSPLDIVAGNHQAGAHKASVYHLDGSPFAMPPLPLPSPASLAALQRVLLIALLVPVVAVMAVGSLPALVVLPFLPNGTDRATHLLTANRAYLNTLLTGSRPTP
jgi:hypothetical protein